MTILRKKRKPKPSLVFDTYWRFAAKRQEIFFNKIQDGGHSFPDDEILRKHKFTNAYRASDRVSQYLLKKVIYSGDQIFEEIFFRTLLFKIFNKIETWELLENSLVNISIANFDFKKCTEIILTAINKGASIYSGAYIMASGKSAFGHERKFQNHLDLIQSMLDDKLPSKLQQSTSLEGVYNLLKSYPSIGSFLAFQYTIDLNYCSLLNFSEMDFVMAGPGAKDGIRKCFLEYGDYNTEDIIRYVADSQEKEFERLCIDFKDLWGRRLQLVDCQNLFCEVDKYSRVAHPEITGLSDRKRIKQKYLPKKEKIFYWYPPKWGINSNIIIKNPSDNFFQSKLFSA